MRLIVAYDAKAWIMTVQDKEIHAVFVKKDFKNQIGWKKR